MWISTLIKFPTPNNAFLLFWLVHLYWFTHILNHLIWKCIAPTVAELKRSAKYPDVRDFHEINKKIILFALVGYEVGYSQRALKGIIVKYLCNIYIISWITHALWLVLIFGLSEDRCIDDVIIPEFLLVEICLLSLSQAWDKGNNSELRGPLPWSPFWLKTSSKWPGIQNLQSPPLNSRHTISNNQPSPDAFIKSTS